MTNFTETGSGPSDQAKNQALSLKCVKSSIFIKFALTLSENEGKTSHADASL